MALTRKVKPVSIPKSPVSKYVGARRRIVMTFEVETNLYPAEICEPTRIALEAAGIAVVEAKAEWAPVSKGTAKK